MLSLVIPRKRAPRQHRDNTLR